MGGAVLIFLLTQLICPAIGCGLAYLHAMQKRIEGASGQELERDISQISSLFALLLSVISFMLVSEMVVPWHRLPVLHEIAVAMLGSNPGGAEEELQVRMLVCIAVGAAMAVVARSFSFSLNRRLVRRVPRFQAAPKR